MVRDNKYLLKTNECGKLSQETIDNMVHNNIHKFVKVYDTEEYEGGELCMLVETPEILFVKYFDKELVRLEHSKKGNLVDVRSRIDIEIKAGEDVKIPLGFAMQLPDGYMAKLYPRSSTFKNYGILLVNSVGNIDNSFCGDDDEWMMHVYATRDTVIHKNDRIGQFELTPIQPELAFLEVAQLGNQNRGGFGSTGVK